MSVLADRVVAWQLRAGRHDLPWQESRDPYAVWLSEIMLQQTQAATVIPYFRRFMERFPDVATLAGAELDDVLRLWSGLGYYTRARNLHRAAQLVMTHHGGAFPPDPKLLAELPGVGRSTAAAVAALAFGVRAAILDGNVKRVFARCLGIEGYPGERAVEQRLWREAEDLLPGSDMGPYTQGLMDLGATVCTRRAPRCGECPLSTLCVARRDGRTGELPWPRPAKSVPERAVHMPILLWQGAVLLERRPPSGIWGGLWSLPELEPAADVQEACRARYGVTCVELPPLPPVRHAFTHFRLNITPRPLRVTALAAVGEGDTLHWVAAADVLSAPLPAPVRRILAQVPLVRAVTAHPGLQDDGQDGAAAPILAPAAQPGARRARAARPRNKGDRNT